VFIRYLICIDLELNLLVVESVKLEGKKFIPNIVGSAIYLH
jgi:hypothetical protein